LVGVDLERVDHRLVDVDAQHEMGAALQVEAERHLVALEKAEKARQRLPDGWEQAEDRDDGQPDHQQSAVHEAVVAHLVFSFSLSLVALSTVLVGVTTLAICGRLTRTRVLGAISRVRMSSLSVITRPYRPPLVITSSFFFKFSSISRCSFCF